MFEGRPLHELGYADLHALFEEGKPEGTRLDYKLKWGEEVVRDAAAFANTAGGDIIIGVDEKAAQGKRKGKTDVPDPDKVYGESGIKNWKADIEAKIRSRTRPPVIAEVVSVPIPAKPERAVVVIRVPESQEPPHEDHVGPEPAIFVRRGPNTVSAGVDDVERMMRQREQARRSRTPLDVEFFHRRLGPEPCFDPERRGHPPTVAVAIRPSRVAGLRLTPDTVTDNQLEELSMTSYLTNNRELRPTPWGVVIESPASGTPKMRVEVHRDGTILGAEALRANVETRSATTGEVVEREATDFGAPGEPVVEDKELAFLEMTDLALNVTRFAARTYSLVRLGVDMEVVFGVSGCQGHRLDVSQQSMMPGGPFYQQPVTGREIMRVDPETGKALDEDLFRMVRDLSRWFGLRLSDRQIGKCL